MLWTLNGVLAVVFLILLTRKGLLSYFKGGRIWLTWLSIGIITMMDEFSSIFYAPSEARRFIGFAAILFIPLTAIFIRFLTTRMVEIAEILHIHGLKGGGVYNFSYFVLGPVASFAAVASILVDYILTASISAVSAVENAGSFFLLSHPVKLMIMLGLIWAIAGLNILGIRENARVTFGIFLVMMVVFINLVGIGLLQLQPENIVIMKQGISESITGLTSGGFGHGIYYMVIALSSCILAYSGVESVMQTAGLVEDWKVIGKAYLFLALSVGIITPLISVLVLSQTNIDFAAHETDLITHFATLLQGQWFGITVGLLASIVLVMAINTAFVASSELVEKVCHRYGFDWPIKPNRRASLYRIHIANAFFYSLIVLLTQGSQGHLAAMYAIGLIACFLINLLSLLIYRYQKGTKEVPFYHVGRLGTLLLFSILLLCFIYLCYHKPHGFLLWLVVTTISLLIGVYGTRKRAPELKEIEQSESPMDMVLFIA
ncbi:MAG: amino acid permease, partial [bacterium]|nr:amino acid permease [bacterium]